MSGVRAFLLLAAHAGGRTFVGRRGLLLLLLAGVPVVLSWVLVRHGRGINIEAFVAVMVMLVLQFVVPLAGLFLGVAALGDEIEGRTVTYLFTRPQPRPLIFLARYAGVAVAFVLLLMGSLAVASLIFSSRVPITAREAALSAGIAGLGFLAYSALFAALRLFFQRALFFGFIAGFIFEGLVSKLPHSGVSRWSIWHHGALLERRLFERPGESPLRLGGLLDGIASDETAMGSIVILVVVVALSLVLGSLRILSRETRLTNAPT